MFDSSLKSASPYYKYGVLVAVLLHLADRFSKWLVVHHSDVPEHIVSVFNGFNLVMVWNRGVSFGMLSGADARHVLIALTLVVTAYLTYWMLREKSYTTVFALGLIIGGATGNIVDRLYYKAVADFLDFYVGNYHWPAFNIADSGICVGVILLIVQQVFSTSRISSHSTKE